MNNYDEVLKKYNEINNSFQKKVIYHVGTDDGFHAEVDAMMECMLYCYVNKIKFVLYADDANFTGGHGWEEFFKPFCQETHFKLNKYANGRYPNSYYGLKYRLLRRILKIITGTEYLTSDIFAKAINKEYGWTKEIEWDLFDVKGTIHDEFAKLSSIALQYNKQTKEEIEELINNLNIPDGFYSIQFRGGDKILENVEYSKTEDVVKRIEEYNIPVKDLFIFSDDYRYIEELKQIKPEWNLYYLIDDKEKGYVNKDFQSLPWNEKRKKMIRYFAQMEMCLRSKMHLGYEYSCTNNYFRSFRNPSEYFAVVVNSGLSRKSSLETGL